MIVLLCLKTNLLHCGSSPHVPGSPLIFRSHMGEPGVEANLVSSKESGHHSVYALERGVTIIVRCMY